MSLIYATTELVPIQVVATSLHYKFLSEFHFGVDGWLMNIKLNSVALVRERTMPNERPPLFGEVSANFCG
jgi:hypothetical protein